MEVNEVRAMRKTQSKVEEVIVAQSGNSLEQRNDVSPHKIMALFKILEL